LNPSKKVAFQLEIRTQTKPETPAIPLDIAVLRPKEGICQDHGRALIRLIPDSQITAELQFFYPITYLNF
jgi:hypothetical protein